MTPSGRFLALVVLFACMMQLYECGPSWGKGKGKKEKKEKYPQEVEEKSFEELQNDASKAFKSMFVWSRKLSEEDILAGIQALQAYHGPTNFPLPINIDTLLSMKDPQIERCEDYDYLKSLMNFVKSTEQFPAIYPWTRAAFKKQILLCNHGEKLETKLKAFQQTQDWKVLERFYGHFFNYAPENYNIDADLLDETYPLNQAMTDMANSDAYKNVEESMKFHKAHGHVVSACANFKRQVGPSILLLTLDSEVGRNSKAVKHLRRFSVCEQFGRTNFLNAYNDVSGMGNWPW